MPVQLRQAESHSTQSEMVSFTARGYDQSNSRLHPAFFMVRIEGFLLAAA
jgi:hypothetical protein